MNANDKRLTELLERWQNGDFTRADEQELQRLLAGGDQFSHEAAEGFAAFPEENHTQRLERLRKKIAPDQNKKVFRTGRFMAIAAAFALLIAAVYWISSPGFQEQKVAQAPTVPTLSQTAPVMVDGNSNTVLQQESVPAGKGKMAADGPGKAADAASKPSAILSAPITSASKDEIDDEVAAAGESAPLAYMDSVTPFSNANVKEREDIRTTPQNAVLQPPVAAPNSAPKTEQYDQKTMNADKVKSRGSAVSESKSAGNAKKKAIASPSPAGGWDKFRIDMRNKMNLTQTARDKGLNSGTVTMTLDINPATGKIRSVLFVNRLGYGCDEAAEQFVQGYNWVVMPGGATEVEVEVIFR